MGVMTSAGPQCFDSAISSDVPAVLMVLMKMNLRECEMITEALPNLQAPRGSSAGPGRARLVGLRRCAVKALGPAADETRARTRNALAPADGPGCRGPADTTMDGFHEYAGKE